MAYQPNYERSYGNKYEETKDLGVVEVAKRIKKDLRSEFPEFKWSVRTQKYSGGQSIRVKIKDAPESFSVYNSEWLSAFNETGRYPMGVAKHSEDASALLKSAERIVEAYNFDGSDAMVDYFDVRFYKDVDFDHKFAKRRREKETLTNREAEVKAKLEATRAKVAQLNDQIEALESQLA